MVRGLFGKLEGQRFWDLNILLQSAHFSAVLLLFRFCSKKFSLILFFLVA